MDWKHRSELWHQFFGENPQPLGDALVASEQATYCPKCQSKMQAVACNGTRVDCCNACGGLWFGVLAHEDLRRQPNVAEIAAGLDLKAGQPQPHGPEKRLCPRCQTPLVAVRDPVQAQIELDKCPVDYGVFFDAGEFKDWADISLLERLRHMLGISGH